MTTCPFLTLLFGIALPLYVGYLGAVASNYNVVVDIDFANYLKAQSHLQSMENAYTKLAADQAARVTQKARRELLPGKPLEKRPNFSLTIVYQLRGGDVHTGYTHASILYIRLYFVEDNYNSICTLGLSLNSPFRYTVCVP
jgi:hypothetical protein